MDPNRNTSTPHTGINNEGDEMQLIDNDSLTNRQSNQNIQNPDARNPTYFTGFSMVPPNESRRSKMQRMAQKELEDLEKYKAEHRAGPIHLAPETLGGGVSLAEARQRQQMEVGRAKIKKKLTKEEMDKRKRQEVEEQNQKMKAIQREKTNRQKMKNEQEDEQRRELYQHDQQRRTEEHLQRLEISSSVPIATSNSTPTSSWARGREHQEARRAAEQAALQRRKDEQRRKGEILKEKQTQEEEAREWCAKQEHSRVNSAFLDRLEARGSGRAPEWPLSPPEGGNIWQADEPQDPPAHPGPSSSQLHSDSAQMEEEEDADRDWAVMRLQNQFPYYEREMLEDIVSQCKGNYHQAYDLLNV